VEFSICEFVYKVVGFEIWVVGQMYSTC
jgi:hypothetical protein